MIETEIKINISEEEYYGIIRKIINLEFKLCAKIEETDVYYNNLERDYFKTGEALRIRSAVNLINHEKHSFITYKGKKLDSLSNTRVEHEASINDTSSMNLILKSLGFSEVLTVIKKREYYKLGNITICADNVENLGYYIELEKIVNNENEKKQALDELFSLLTKLGLDIERLEKKSYLELLAEKSN